MRFEYSSAVNSSFDEYQEQLEELLINSVKRRYDPNAKLAVSLSAGHESRAIVGVFHKNIQPRDVYCFSYALSEDPPEDSDAFLAEKIASYCGYSHKIYKSYNGNLIQHLEANAKETRCIAEMCIELDMWHKLAEDGNLDLFVGDEPFGTIAVDTCEEILEKYGLRGTHGIKWLRNFLSRRSYQHLCNAIKQLGDEIIGSAADYAVAQDKNDIISLNQHKNHRSMAWREFFCSQAGYVHNPFMDREIFEFVQHTPPWFRGNTMFFRTVIKKIYPELFAIGIARESHISPNWQAEIDANRELLKAHVLQTDSRLDGLISKAEILKALDQKETVPYRIGYFLFRAVNALRRRWKTLDEILNPFIGPRNRRGIGEPALLLIRLLIIRMYLSTP
jgi:hypothetical protein